MNIHKNARLTRHGRERIVRLASGQTPNAIANSVGVCPRTVRKWLKRYKQEGPAGLLDRSSRPHRLYHPLPAVIVERVAELRRRRWTGKQIAAETGVSPATVSRVLRRIGLNKLSALEPAEPVRRYQRENPGELIHIDIKKLGRIGGIGHRITGDRRQRVRGIGWEFVHVCIDDCSRLAYAEVLGDERSVTVAGFLRRAVAWFARRGVVAQRVLSDNGSAYRSRLVAAACHALELGHRFTRPYTPRTNGKAERFIQTLLREWAYAVAYSSSALRTAALARWLHYYNWHRPHSALHRQPPISRVVGRDDLLRLQS
jgi:transposase InsO family protein